MNARTWTGLSSLSMTEDSEKPQRRVFPPLYKSSGDPASDRLAFFHIIERLKVRLTTIGVVPHRHVIVSQTQKRTGWVDNKVILSSDVVDLLSQHKNDRSQTPRGKPSPHIHHFPPVR